MKNKGVRNLFITLFVMVWIAVFHSESVRGYYLEPMLGRPLQKMPFLFPPAGWIMFVNVDDRFSHIEVYGIANGALHRLDPHEIIATRFIGFDNIHRNILGSVASRRTQQPFCHFLERKLPGFDNFVVTAVEYPSLTKDPHHREQAVLYQCQ